MIIHHIILAILWSLFCFFHSVLANIRIREEIQKRLGKGRRYYRIYYSLFALLSLLAVVFYQLTIPSRFFFHLSLLPRILAGILLGAGLVIMLICTHRYFFTVTGLRQLFEEKETSVLLISGIHRYVRHPLYLGTFLVIWALFLLIPLASVLIMNSVITLYTLAGIRLEEKKLVREFGSAYEKYRKNVPMLLPFPGKKRGERILPPEKGISSI